MGSASADVEDRLPYRLKLLEISRLYLTIPIITDAGVSCILI